MAGTPTAMASLESVDDLLPGISEHPHARAVLGPALVSGGRPSHAYLFHGPAGAGKRAVARAFAAQLLAEGAAAPETVSERVERGSHPDLTWVTPSGAAEMLVSDIDEPVVAAATRTPFESRRRVFVIESAEAMNDQAANRLLKTLEEPPSFAHLVLLTDRREDVLATISSRCQQVRFDARSPERIAGELTGVEGLEAEACARLALGDAVLAAMLASPEGTALRGAAEAFVRSALRGETQARPWMGLLETAKAAGARAGEQAQERLTEELELVAGKERKRYERESLEARRRGERRARTRSLDLGLRLAELWLRDAMCVLEDAGEIAHAADRMEELREDADASTAGTLRAAIELVGATRLSLSLNVSEELALESLAYRIQSL